MPNVARRFVPGSNFLLSGHFRLRCAEPILHDPLEVVFHYLAGYIFFLHTSIYVGVEGVGNDRMDALRTKDGCFRMHRR